MAPGTAERSVHYRLAEVLLAEQGPLDRFVSSRRELGKSWRTIANELRDAVDVDIAPETLRSWFADDPALDEAAS